MPEEGLEPSPCCQDGILNPARLPIPPLRRWNQAGIIDDGDFSVNPQFAVESRRIGKVRPEMLFRQRMCVILWAAGPWNQGGALVSEARPFG